jgi:hypothetical protein
MANTDILNPNIGYSTVLGFNPNWNYGGPRKPGANYSTVRPRFGRWQTRSVGDSGYSFDMVFVDRPIQQVWYVKRFYEQFQNGFFTIIDYDNQSRQHVGRFTSYADDTHTANLKYTIRVTFEESPGAPMLEYPSNFANEGCMIYTVDDWISTQGVPNMRVATSGATWVLQQTPAAVLTGALATDPSSYEVFEAVTNVNDLAQMEYQGWGFMMTLRLAPYLGLCNLYVDGVLMLGNIDLSTGAILAPEPGINYSVDELGLQLTMAQLPLGRHRVMLVACGTQNANATGNGLIFPALQVMH